MATVVIRAQKRIMPIVSMRVRPCIFPHFRRGSQRQGGLYIITRGLPRGTCRYWLSPPCGRL